MSTAVKDYDSMIAVIQAAKDRKPIEARPHFSKDGGPDWKLLTEPGFNFDEFDYRVAEERPREWEVSGANGGVWMLESGPRLTYGETVRVTELPDGWEVRRKEEPEWRYFHSTIAKEQPWRLHRDGSWEKKNTWNDEWVGDARLVETDAAGRPLEKP